MRMPEARLQISMSPRTISVLLDACLLKVGPSRASLATSLTHYRYENGRRYHAYREGEPHR